MSLKEHIILRKTAVRVTTVAGLSRLTQYEEPNVRCSVMTHVLSPLTKSTLEGNKSVTVGSSDKPSNIQNNNYVSYVIFQ